MSRVPSDFHGNGPEQTPPRASSPASDHVTVHSSTEGTLQRLELPGTPESMPIIRQTVVEAAQRCGFCDEDVAKVEMAVGEACTNIIEHAYRTQPLKMQIEIEVLETHDRLEVLICDYSTINFPIDDASGISLDDYIATGRQRGLGLYIIRSFVDRLEHRFVCGRGNELRLVKFFA